MLTLRVIQLGVGQYALLAFHRKRGPAVPSVPPRTVLDTLKAWAGNKPDAGKSGVHDRLEHQIIGNVLLGTVSGNTVKPPKPS